MVGINHVSLGAWWQVPLPSEPSLPRFYFLMMILNIAPEKTCSLQSSSKDEETQGQEARHTCTPLLFHTLKFV